MEKSEHAVATPADTLRPWKKPVLQEEDYSVTELGSGGPSFDLETYS